MQGCLCTQAGIGREAVKMIDLKILKGAAQDLLKFAERQKDVREAEAYASCNRLNVYRIAYHSKIPSNGLEEPKSSEDFGLSLRILFKDGKYGFGSSDSSLSAEGFREAYQKAFDSRVADDDFHSLPEAQGKVKAKPQFDPKIMKTDEAKGISKAYELIDAAFSSLRKSKFAGGINITGEVDLSASRFCVMSTKGISAIDENTSALATLTTSLEAEDNATGTSFESSTHLKKLDGHAAGKESAERAISMQNPHGMESGKYKVVLSENVVAELFYSRFDVALSSIDYNASPFIGRIGQKVGAEEFSVSDEPLLKGFIGSKIVTDEGLPSRRVEIIKNGVLQNYLSNDYYSKKKPEWKRFGRFNGYRSGTERSYGSDVGINGSNIVVAKGNHSAEELLEEVRNGIYVGRMWYTYPVNGYASPDYTGTIRGDSFIIKNGEITGALTPNTMRVLDSFDNFMGSITGIGKKQKAILAWGQEEAIVAPEIALSSLNLKKIAKGV